MKTGPLPDFLQSFLHEPNLATISTMRSDATPQSVPTWYEWTGSHILVNMDAGRVRLRQIRANPAVAMSIMWHKNWFRHVSIVGRVVELYDDVGMVDIDRIAHRYIGIPYKNRENPRVSGRIAIERWLGWDASTFQDDGVASAISQSFS